MYTIVHGIAGYFFLLIVIRLLSRRPGAQMTMSEFVLVFLVGGIIILATAGDDHSMTNCVCGVMVIGLLHRTTTYLKRKSRRFAAIVDGTPLVLLKNGEWQVETMRCMRMDDADVMAAARTKGVQSLNQIRYAVLERNGAISVIPQSES